MPVSTQAVTSGQLGIGQTKWQDRVREAAYTSPKGVRVVFAYEDVGREYDKRTTAFEFPGVDGAYVQDNGHGPRSYPLRCFFNGDNHDRIATLFEEALLDRGAGKLEHPFYGTFNVVPFGRIARRDDLKTAANQTIIEVAFLTDIGAVYPSPQGSPRSEISAALDAFDLAGGNQFAASTNLRSAVAKANTKSTIRKFLRDVSAELNGVSESVTSVTREFRDIQQLINFGLDVLIGQPLQLALQISNLIKAPARALIGLQSRLEAYERLALRIIGSTAASGTSDATQLARLKLRLSNDFHTSDLFAMNSVSGSVLSALENTYATRPQALTAAADVLAQFDAIVPWREARYDGLDQVDTGDSYQALQNAVALLVGYLIESSFSLATERVIVLDRPRTIVDLSAELYGSVSDERLNFLIDSNNLTGSAILELERGQSIVYYV